MSNSEAVSLLMNNQYYEQGYKQGSSDILNKIRAEIEFEVDHRTNMLCAEDVFQIIDMLLNQQEKYYMKSPPK